MGSLFIIVAYVVFRDQRTFGRKLLFILSTQDLMASVAYSLPGAHSRAVCKIQSVTITFFACTSIAWTTCITYYIYVSVSSGTPAAMYEKRFHFASWTYSGICAIVVAVLRTGWSDIWCWVPSSSLNNDIVRFLLFYGPLWLIWLYNFVLYMIVHARIRRLLDMGASPYYKRVAVLQKLVYIPLILVMLRLPGSLNRTLDFFHHHYYWLDCLQAAGDPAQGFADAIMFGALNKKIWRRFYRLLLNCRLDSEDASVLSQVSSYGADDKRDQSPPPSLPPESRENSVLPASEPYQRRHTGDSLEDEPLRSDSDEDGARLM